MNLQTLTEHLRPPAPGFQCQLTGVSYDSRTVQPGHVFVAIKGTHVDGHDYIANAIERGATVVVHQDEVNEVTGVEYVRVPDSRVALSPLAAAWYGTPASNIRVVGVTGTKGKTTTSTLCAHVLDADGRRSGLITTAQFKVADRWWDNTTRQTTPEALEVHALLREMVLARCDYAVVEASSHALSPNWNRLGDAQFDVAVFTNVTHEHLDYHGTVEQYRRDKARLFEMLSAPSSHGGVHKQRKLAVVNLDDPHAALYLEAAGPTVEHLTYAIEHPHAQYVLRMSP
jgi:UDP-N-acetylmuramoyl-L-alanyl-D-glutamate--2,6-diaminopimelate ligase